MNKPEQMIKQYLLDEESYLSENTVEDVEIKGDVIQFESRSDWLESPEKCHINLLDVITWLYSKSSERS